MNQENETTDLIKPLAMVFIIVFTSTLIVYKIFGYEIGLLYCISLSVAILSMGLAGLENIIIRKNN